MDNALNKGDGMSSSSQDIGGIIANVVGQIAEFTEVAAKIESFMVDIDTVKAKALNTIVEERDKSIAIVKKEIVLKQGEAVADIQDKKAGAVKAVLVEKSEALTAIKNAKESAVQAVVTAQLGYSLGKADSPENAKPEDKGYMNS